MDDGEWEGEGEAGTAVADVLFTPPGQNVIKRSTYPVGVNSSAEERSSAKRTLFA